MPRIPEYTAPNAKLRGSEQGLGAWETAGRRLSGQYREAATALAKTSQVKAATLADKAQWPFNLFALQEKIRLSQEAAAKAAAPPEVGFKIAGGANKNWAGLHPPSPAPLGFTSPVNPNSVGGGYGEYTGSTSTALNNSLAAQANELVSRIGSTIGPVGSTSSSTGYGGGGYVTGTPASDPRYNTGADQNVGGDYGGGSAGYGNPQYGTYDPPNTSDLSSGVVPVSQGDL